ncbi:tetratricopeptide repeat protein [Cyanobacteria bacterium FACHB-472]|nr:tetratricopeptide repeat protein [Cyanobacteria bacterium FACHB-472]
MSDILPSGESVLAELGIDSVAIKFIQPHWKRTHYRAVINWLTKYKPKPDTTNIEKVRGYLEAFHHLCEVEAWEEATAILVSDINGLISETLHIKLFIWGYYYQLAELSNRILGTLDLDLDIILLNDLGRIYHLLEDEKQAFEYWLQSFSLAQETKNYWAMGAVLGNLGVLYASLGDYSEAIEYNHQSLTFAIKSKNVEGEQTALMNIGMAHNHLGNHEKAIEFCKQSLAIAREIPNRLGEAAVLQEIGNAYRRMGEPEQAFDFYKQSLRIMLETEDELGKGSVLFNIGNLLIEIEKYLDALKYLQASLEVRRKIKRRCEEAETLMSIGEIYYHLACHDLARECIEQAVIIFTQLGIPLSKEDQELKGKLLS